MHVVKFSIIDTETGEVFDTTSGVQRAAYLLVGRSAQNTRVFKEDEPIGRHEVFLNYNIWLLESSLREISAYEN